MTDEIRPALSAEEWAAQGRGGPLRVQWNDNGEVVATLNESTRHKTAAICLYGQTFGFTWEDVDALRRVADLSGHGVRCAGDEAAVALALATASKLAALLPPREEG